MVHHDGKLFVPYGTKNGWWKLYPSYLLPQKNFFKPSPSRTTGTHWKPTVSDCYTVTSEPISLLPVNSNVHVWKRRLEDQLFDKNSRKFHSEYPRSEHRTLAKQPNHYINL